jgi:hypothetical protein
MARGVLWEGSVLVSSCKLGWTPASAAFMACVVCATAVRAQEAPSSPNGSDRSTTFDTARRIGRAFSHPLHPVIQTVASGGSLGTGLGYTFPTADEWQLGTKAVVTPRGYWLAQADGVYTGRRAQIGGYVRARHMNRLNFFGTSGAGAADRATFTLRDPVLGVFATVRTARGITFGGRVERLWPRVAAGRHPGLPSIEQRFSEVDAPGLSLQPRFARYQALVDAVAPASAGWASNQGGRYRVTWDIYDDQQLEQYDFQRVQIEARHKIGIVRPYHTLSLHGWVSSATATGGGTVPFYLQHSLGGTGHLRSPGEELVGGDGTAATLRGYQNFRFRGDHLLLLQAEYRFPIWGPVDGSLFTEAGKAVPVRSQLTLADLNHDFGFSLSVMRAAATVVRVDVGFSPEGRRILVGFGGLLP